MAGTTAPCSPRGGHVERVAGVPVIEESGAARVARMGLSVIHTCVSARDTGQIYGATTFQLTSVTAGSVVADNIVAPFISHSTLFPVLLRHRMSARPSPL